MRRQINQKQNKVVWGFEDDPQICVTEKSVEETDKQEKVPDEVTDKSETKQVSAGVKDNP